MKDLVSIDIGDTLVSLRRATSSQGQSGVILGRVTEAGHDRIYLDRRLHKPFDTDTRGEWTISGPFTTVLSRAIGQPKPG